jgi:hypothetical protein
MSGSNNAAEAKQGAELLRALTIVLTAPAFTTGGVWYILNAVLEAPRVLSWLARHLPDQQLRLFMAVR